MATDDSSGDGDGHVDGSGDGVGGVERDICFAHISLQPLYLAHISL